LATVVAVAVAAYAGSDMVHEVLGHGLACAFSPTVRALSLSTVALQTDSSSRLIAAAGSIANIVVGLLAAALFRRRSAFDTKGYFLGLFTITNLLNGTGYLLFSGLLDVGDWALVIEGREPRWIWRSVIALGGAALYALVVRSAALQVIALVQRGLIAREEPSRLLFPAYITGGLLLVLGSALNPISPGLILSSGVSSGFGAMAGLAFIPGSVETRTAVTTSVGTPLPFSLGWSVAGIFVSLIFIGWLGPGVRLS
jgi:hypothetical protein